MHIYPTFSLFSSGLAGRLAIATALLALLWIGAFWALA